MNWELLIVAVLAGVANWGVRALPILARMDRMAVGGWLGLCRGGGRGCWGGA